jgi:hypothetical protein
MSTEPDMKAAALWYAAQHIPVFPCKPRDKKPITEHGFKDATIDQMRIEEWWQENPTANIGIPTGAASGFLVVDVDPRNGGPADRSDLIQILGAIPETAEVITGGGGRHVYFRHPGGPVPHKLAEGIDLQGDGNYVLAPPSLHPSGKRYEVDGLAGSKAFLKVAEIPQSLRKWLYDRPQNGNGNGIAPPVADKISHGNRNKELTSLAGSMRRRGMELQEIEIALDAVNQRRCYPPLSPDEVRNIAASVCRYKPASGQARQEDPQAETPPQGEQKKAERERPVALGISDLLKLEAPKRTMLIEALLPTPGAVLLVGAHKSGKTVLAVQMAIAICSSHALFDNYRVLQEGGAIIVEEDDPSGDLSVKDYLEASPVPVTSDKGVDLPFHLFTRTKYHFSPEFRSWLGSEIESRHARVVILDSYTALRPHRHAGGDIVKVESDEMTLLDALAKRNQCTIVVLHHDSKGSFGMDWSDRTAGTFAMGAAVEGQIHISRCKDLPSSAPERLVRTRGRHFEGTEAVIRFRKETLDYAIVIEGAAASLFPEILQIKNQFGNRVFSAKELYQELGLSRTTGYRLGLRLAEGGVLSRRGYGEYQLSTDLLGT